MGWLNGLLNTKCCKGTPRKYVRVVCNRMHCDETCISKESNVYKYWAIMLSKEKIDYKDIYSHIKTLPNILRLGVWLKMLQNKVTIEQPAMVDSDADLVKIVVQYALKMEYSDPESLFNVYKTVERHTQAVSYHIIPFIILVFKMGNATPESVSSVFINLIESHGLLMLANEDEEEPEVEDSQIPRMRVEEVGEIRMEELRAETLQSRQQSSRDASKVRRKTFDGIESDAMIEIWNILARKRCELFVPITDIVITLGCSYVDLFSKAREISQFDDPGKVVSVAGAISNLCYYEGMSRRETKIPKVRKDANYFDFLVVQNEMIKAQERMRTEYEGKLEKLQKEHRGAF